MRSGTFHHKMSSGMMKFRIGYGYDVHALGEGLPLILGGVEIEHAKGCIAHSDGDVVLHAISDALLGAAALGDIGQHFPTPRTNSKEPTPSSCWHAVWNCSGRKVTLWAT